MGKLSTLLESCDKALAIHPNDVDLLLERAAVHLAMRNCDKFFEDIEHGFVVMPTEYRLPGVTNVYCQLLIRFDDLYKNVVPLAQHYAENEVLGTLGQGLTESIAAVLDSAVSQANAENWLSAWETAHGERTELDIPLRLLTAAVEWKKTRDIRALLALPIEERRVLESLLPEVGQNGTCPLSN